MNAIFSNIGMSLPVTNPVLIFSLVLFVILFAPFVSEKFKLPNIIVMILAGVILGEHGVGVLTRDASFELYGTVGMVYIMFLAGIEMDVTDFKKNRKAGVFFGGITFILPMLIGTVSSYFLLQYLPHHELPHDANIVSASEMTSQYYLLVASLLLASMYASHTLISYPIVSKYGVNKNRSISITIGGTMIATTLSLLVLAVIVGMAKGQINSFFWVRMGIAICIFLFIIGLRMCQKGSPNRHILLLITTIFSSRECFVFFIEQKNREIFGDSEKGRYLCGRIVLFRLNYNEKIIIGFCFCMPYADAGCSGCPEGEIRGSKAYDQRLRGGDTVPSFGRGFGNERVAECYGSCVEPSEEGQGVRCGRNAERRPEERFYPP